MTLNTKKNTTTSTGSIWSYMNGENKFSLALVVLAFLGQLVVLCGKYFGFAAFADQLGGFTGEFITLAILYFGGSNIKNAINKKKEAEGTDA